MHAKHFVSSAAHGPQAFYSPEDEGKSRGLALLMQAELAAATGETVRTVSPHIAHYLLDHARMPAVTFELRLCQQPT